MLFFFIPKTDTGLWLGPVEFSPPVALLSIPGRLVRADVFFFIVPVLAGSMAVI